LISCCSKKLHTTKSQNSNTAISKCVQVKVIRLESAGFDYKIINTCEFPVYLIKDFELILEFENETNWQNPKISTKRVFPSIQWKNEKTRREYFSSISDCGSLVVSTVPYYTIKKDSAIASDYSLVRNNFQTLKKGKSYKGKLTIRVPVEYSDICPRFFIGDIVTEFIWQL